VENSKKTLFNLILFFLKLNNLDFHHMFLSYTVEGAQKAMKEYQRAKSGKKKKQNKKVDS